MQVFGLLLIVIALVAIAVIVYNIQKIIERMQWLVALVIGVCIMLGGGITVVTNNSNGSVGSVAVEQDQEEASNEKSGNDKVEKNKEESNAGATPLQNNSTSTENEVNLATETLDIKSVSSSSVLSDGLGISYDANLIFDRDRETAWVEGASGNGVNEWVELNLYTDSLITEVGINAGYTKNQDIYYKNNRPKKVKLTFEDGTQKVAELKDAYVGKQFIKLDKPIRSSYVTITILDVYKGSKYDDTCITEVEIIGTEVTQNEQSTYSEQSINKVTKVEIETILTTTVDNYAQAFASAVNYNEFGYIVDYLEEGSSMYDLQRNAISDIHGQGITEEYVNSRVTDYSFNEGTNTGTVKTEEEYNISYANGEVKNKVIPNEYRYVYDYSTENIKLTEYIK